jgi:hypothetical protein
MKIRKRTIALFLLFRVAHRADLLDAQHVA